MSTRGATCFECDAPAEHEHHVVPRSFGGQRTVPLCEACHGRVHGFDLRVRALTRRALQAKRARGERAGTVPYGYSANDTGRLTPNAAEQEVIAMVGARRVAGAPLRRIVVELAREGLKSRAGKPFQLTQVANIAKVAFAETHSMPPSPTGKPTAVTVRQPRSPQLDMFGGA